MKVNVIKTEIDYLEISKTTSEVQCLINREPVIFMNDETAKQIEADAAKYFTISKSKTNKGHIVRYEGYKVFIDNDLEYGEIEVR